MENFVALSAMSNGTAHRIAFVGPVALAGESPRGGYQACNQRTVSALRTSGIRVEVLRYPEPSGSALRKGVSYFLGFASLAWKVLRWDGQITHFTGLYKHFIYPELLFVTLARLKGHKVIYDIRAGSAHKYYEQRSSLYRSAFRATLRSADAVMVEGAEYIDFVREIAGKSAYLLPNHVSLPENMKVARVDAGAAVKEITLVFAGRIVENKGIEIVLQAVAILREQGLKVDLKIAGTGLPAYVATLKERYRHPNNEWLGSIASSQVLALFSSSHFFLFPTTHSGEGHSNALTEAMAAGCVPLASKNGFNQSVIDDCGRVLPQSATPADYASALLKIVRSNQWSAISRAASERAHTRYETGRVVSALVEQYGQLGAGKCR